MKIYRHYGSSKFVPEKMNTNITNRWIKPGGGLWASPIDSSRGWKDFCEDEQFKLESLDEYFDFMLNPSAKIYQIKCLKDLFYLVDHFPGKPLDDFMKFTYEIFDPKMEEDEKKVIEFFPDFTNISKDYDGIEVSISNDYRLYHAMYGWDVDSIVVWNPEIVIPM